MKKKEHGIHSWLLVYLVLSIPVIMFYAMGLSGWFFEYPMPLIFLIFFVFTAPLVAIVKKSPKAPTWNITILWIQSVLLTLRALSVIFFEPFLLGADIPYDAIPILLWIVLSSIIWSTSWTLYFKRSKQVKNTF